MTSPAASGGAKLSPAAAAALVVSAATTLGDLPRCARACHMLAHTHVWPHSPRFGFAPERVHRCPEQRSEQQPPILLPLTQPVAKPPLVTRRLLRSAAWRRRV